MNIPKDVHTPITSVVMTTYNRASLLAETLATLYGQWKDWRKFEVVVVDDGDGRDNTDNVCRFSSQYLPVWYFKRHRDPANHYSNPAVPNNIGIRHAHGQVIILQNAECRHVTEQSVAKLTAKVMDEPNTAFFASVQCLDPQGQPNGAWYTHSQHSPRPFFFCGAILKDHFVRLRGFDEDYLYYGWDDNDMADRLRKIGVRFEYADDILIQHQWHPSSYRPEDHQYNEYNRFLYQQKSQLMAAGLLGVERNLDRPDWGVL